MSDASPHGRASLLTPPGRGAVAVIAAEGPAAAATVDACFRARNRLRLSDQPPAHIIFGHWSDGAAHREEVVVCRTGEAAVEIHCHGGVAAAERILSALADGGCRVEPWSDWLRRQTPASIEAEADAALVAATTLRTAAILLDQRQGALGREFGAIEVELAAGSQVGTAAARERIGALVDRTCVGLHLAQPWQVAIAGRPNVGKSSLINALVGYERAIVFDQPGTTRDVLAAETAIDGWPVRLTDAAGLRAPADELEAAGVDLARAQLARADLVVWVLDAAALAPGDLNDPESAAEREMAADADGRPAAPPLVVVNKTDLAAGPTSGEAVGTCALSGAGIESLLVAIARRLVPEAPEPGSAVPFTARQLDLLRLALKHADERNVAAALAALKLIDSQPPSSL